MNKINRQRNNMHSYNLKVNEEMFSKPTCPPPWIHFPISVIVFQIFNCNVTATEEKTIDNKQWLVIIEPNSKIMILAIYIKWKKIYIWKIITLLWANHFPSVQYVHKVILILGMCLLLKCFLWNYYIPQKFIMAVPAIIILN